MSNLNIAQFSHECFNRSVGHFIMSFNNCPIEEFNATLHKMQLQVASHNDREFIAATREFLNELSAALNAERVHLTLEAIREVEKYLPESGLAAFVASSKVQPK